MIGYRRKLEQDLVRWHASGWVTTDGVCEIKSELARAPAGVGLPGVLAMLGAILLAFGAMLFVAANWQDMSRLSRLVLLVGSMWAVYAIAGLLFRRGLDAFAQAAVMLGSALFGTSIMLIAQMYHIDGNPPDAVLTWAAGSGLAAVLLRSNASFVLTIILIGVWSMWESIVTDDVHWLYLIAWGLVAVGLRSTTRWRPAFHLLCLGMLLWVATLGYVLPQSQGNFVVTAIGLAVLALFSLAGPLIDKALVVSKAATGYGFVLAFAGLFGMQFVEDLIWWSSSLRNPWRAANGLPMVLLAAITLALTFGAIMWGARTSNRVLMWLGYVGFSLEILALYFKTLGSLMDTSLFFLLAGILAIALAWFATLLHRRQAAKGVAT